MKDKQDLKCMRLDVCLCKCLPNITCITFDENSVKYNLSKVLCVGHLSMREEPPKTQNLFIKICIYSYMLNFSHLQSTLHLMQYTYGDFFLHCSKQFLNLSILMPFSATAGLFHLFHISNMFSFEGFFHTRETKQSHWG